MCQYRLVQLLTGQRAMFTAVGDDDQAIYAGAARPSRTAKLTTDYPNIKLIKLEQNYRSVQRILAAANSVIERNPKLFEKNCGPTWARASPSSCPPWTARSRRPSPSR